MRQSVSFLKVKVLLYAILLSGFYGITTCLLTISQLKLIFSFHSYRNMYGFTTVFGIYFAFLQSLFLLAHVFNLMFSIFALLSVIFRDHSLVRKFNTSNRILSAINLTQVILVAALIIFLGSCYLRKKEYEFIINRNNITNFFDCQKDQMKTIILEEQGRGMKVNEKIANFLFKEKCVCCEKFVNFMRRRAFKGLLVLFLVQIIAMDLVFQTELLAQGVKKLNGYADLDRGPVHSKGGK